MTEPAVCDVRAGVHARLSARRCRGWERIAFKKPVPKSYIQEEQVTGHRRDTIQVSIRYGRHR